MKRLIYNLFMASFLIGATVLFQACGEEEEPQAMPTGTATTFTLNENGGSSISGVALFEELDNGATRVTLTLNGTPSGGVHPAHIHANSAAEGGGIAVDLTSVDGTSGESITEITELNDGTAVTYQDLVDFDGHINVHLSAEDLGTVVARGDIGGNVLTGSSEVFELEDRNDSGVSGTATFSERQNGETLVEISLTGTPAGGDHPSHIHNDNAATGGGIAASLSNINGDNGYSATDIATLDDGTPISYGELISFDGYINVHLSADDLGTIVSQGDIGENILTGEEVEYDLRDAAGIGVSGMATFMERVNGETLVEIELDGTPEGGIHPSHIHNNTAAEGGGIAASLTAINGDTGFSATNIAALDDGTAITYTELIAFDGYINVHLSAEALGTIVSQGDIGQNVLTGEEVVYPLGDAAGIGVSGSAIFKERFNGETLVEISLTGTPAGGDHPAHIHNDNAATGGGIAVSLTNINGDTGFSATNISALNDGTSITYTELIAFDGYINVHLSAEDLATIVSQGDIGGNALTGEEASYTLDEANSSGVSGTIIFKERVNGESLVEVSLTGTPAGGDHPMHIHDNDAATGGGIAVSLTNVNGDTGYSATNVSQKDDGTAITYTELVDYNGHVNVHLSADDLATVVASGDVGSNG